MSKNNNIEKLFQEKFATFDAKVDPKAWNAVQNNLGSNMGASSSIGGLKGGLFGGVFAAITIVGMLTVNSVISNVTEINKEVFTSVSSPVEDQTIIKSEKTFQNKIEAAAVEDELVRSHMTEIMEDSKVSNEQKAALEVILNTQIPEVSIEKEKIELEIFENHKSNPVIDKDLVVKAPAESNYPIESINRNSEKVDQISNEENNTVIKEVQVVKSKLIKIPNALTPNGDYINDEYLIESEGLESMYFVVVDNKGKTIYESNEIDFKWDGTDLFGNKLPEGNYMCVIKATGFDGVVHQEMVLCSLKRR